MSHLHAMLKCLGQHSLARSNMRDQEDFWEAHAVHKEKKAPPQQLLAPLPLT